MIITRTPLRISFLGGGTDFQDFYKTEPGCVLSSTIDKYIFVILKRRFDDQLRVNYTRNELVESVSQIEHDLVRESLRLTGIEGGVEVVTMGDIPSRGSGLGSSSTVTVGLLHAMWSYLGELPDCEQLAEGACQIEIDRLGRPIGKQDQYAAAYGGLRFIKFYDSDVTVGGLANGHEVVGDLGDRLMLFFTGVTRCAGDVLREQKANIEDIRPTLRAIGELARQGRQVLEEGRLDDLGQLMHEGWEHKRTLASTITNSDIDDLYEKARRAGAIGGKISGAGGGGFLMLYCPPENQQSVRAALHGVRELEFHLEPEGSVTLLNVRRR